MDLVSVIIPTRNRAGYLTEAIESVLSQSRDDFEIELIVVDDGSTDNTPQVVQSYPVVYIKGQGEGVSIARNKGIAEAKGEYLAFLDDDDVWVPGRLAAMLSHLRQHSEHAAVIGQIRMATADLQPVYHPFPDSSFIPDFNGLIDYVPVVGSLVVRKKVVAAVGNFNPDLVGSEDWDWVLRIARQFQVGYVAKVVYLFRQHSKPRAFSDSSKEDFVSWHRYKDTMKVFRTHTRSLSITTRLKLVRRSLKLRGSFAPYYAKKASSYFKLREWRKTALCLNYALRISPLHTLAWYYRSFSKQL